MGSVADSSAAKILFLFDFSKYFLQNLLMLMEFHITLQGDFWWCKKTVVIVAHRLSTVKNAYQIVVIDHGKVVEVGNHELLTAKRVPSLYIRKMATILWQQLRFIHKGISESLYYKSI